MIRKLLATTLALVLVVACGSSATTVSTQLATDAGAPDSSADSDSDASFPLLPYPPGPYGGAVGEVMPDFTVHGYALNRTHRNSAELPLRTIALSEVRSDPACSCMVVIWNAAGTQCGYCQDADQVLSSVIMHDPSTCGLEVLGLNYDSNFSVYPAEPVTRADLDAFTQAGQQPFPVGLVTPSSEAALSGTSQVSIPMHYVVRTSDMHIVGFFTGVGPDAASQIHQLCNAPQTGVETRLSALRPLGLVADVNDAFIADADRGLLHVPQASPAGATSIDPDAPAARALALDAQNVYFARNKTPNFTLERIARTGGGPTLIASATSAFIAIAVDASTVYFTRADGVVGSAPIAGGAPITVLASGENAPTSLAIYDTYVYFVSSARSELARVDKAGGGRVRIAPATDLGSQYPGHEVVPVLGSLAPMDGALAVSWGGGPLLGGIALAPTNPLGGTSQVISAGASFDVLSAGTAAGGALASNMDVVFAATTSLPAWGPVTGLIGYGGANSFTTITPGVAHANGIAVDSSYLYFTIAESSPGARDGSFARFKR
jgi:hypothetical protein